MSSNSSDSRQTVRLKVFESSFAANLALTKLRDEGIPCQLDGGAVWPGVVGVPTDSLGGVGIIVYADDYDRALDLVKDIN